MNKFFKSRYNILFFVIILILVLLAFKMAVLTIVEGSSYRNIADEKRIKDIPIKAPRGKIYDRNGVVLAENVTSFTVQMYKDQINIDSFNDTSHILSKILDENGEKPIDEFPIVLDVFDYINESVAEYVNTGEMSDGSVQTSSTVKAPQEAAIDIVKSNLYKWLNFETVIYDLPYSIKDRVCTVLKKEMNDLPITVKDGKFVFSSDETTLKAWLTSKKYDENITAQNLVIKILTEENKYMLRLFSNSEVRRFSYEFLKSINQVQNIKLLDYCFVQDNEYKTIKRDLSSKYEDIKDSTSAKDDFVNLTKRFSLDNLLTTVYETSNSKVLPGQILCDKLKTIYSDLPVVCKAEGEEAKFEYTDDILKNKYLSVNNMDISSTAYDLVKKLALDEKTMLYEVITDDNVKHYAQTELLKYENPYISVVDWEYSPIKKKKDWVKANLKVKKDKDGKEIEYNAKDVFQMLRESLKISPDINDYEMRNMLVVRERYVATGYRSYHPIDLCYGLSEKTVAMISERSHELSGISIEIEPIRYYPMGSSAAHVLGYLGKISQDYEVKEYVDEKGYSKDDIIGKTGVEEKFESYLRGQKGKKTVEVNAMGTTIREMYQQEPVPGNDLKLTLDINLQKKAEESLKKALDLIQTGGVYESEWGNFLFKDAYKNATSGAVVAIDAKTGEVLALANYPSYDLNMFATGISTEDWDSLLNDSKDQLAPRPLYNIASLTAIQPGSTFKLVTALAALENGVDPNEQVYCSGVMDVGNRKFGCWIYNLRRGTHGYQNMYQAIQNSCNFYFYTAVLGENPTTNQKYSHRVELEDIIETAKKLGLDDKTGIEIDIPEEYSGGVPSVSDKKNSTKVYLKAFLEGHLSEYLESGYNPDNTERKNIIDNITSWIEEEEVISRTEVYTRLKELRLNPEKTNENNIPLVDLIKYSFLNNAAWNPGDSLNISIGQGSNSYTTLQMANYIATIANGGYKHNLSVVRDVKTYDGKPTDYVARRDVERIELNDYSHLETLRYGMKLVSDSDSAKPFAKFPVGVGSKTGTAQKDGINPETGELYDEFAWHISFAPYDDPEIVVACVIFQGGTGRYPIPIAKDIIGEYLKLNDKLPKKEVENTKKEGQ